MNIVIGCGVTSLFLLAQRMSFVASVESVPAPPINIPEKASEYECPVEPVSFWSNQVDILVCSAPDTLGVDPALPSPLAGYRNMSIAIIMMEDDLPFDDYRNHFEWLFSEPVSDYSV
jgi:hypothetical protein